MFNSSPASPRACKEEADIAGVLLYPLYLAATTLRAMFVRQWPVPAGVELPGTFLQRHTRSRVSTTSEDICPKPYNKSLYYILLTDSLSQK